MRISVDLPSAVVRALAEEARQNPYTTSIELATSPGERALAQVRSACLGARPAELVDVGSRIKVRGTGRLVRVIGIDRDQVALQGVEHPELFLYLKETVCRGFVLEDGRPIEFEEWPA